MLVTVQTYSERKIIIKTIKDLLFDAELVV